MFNSFYISNAPIAPMVLSARVHFYHIPEEEGFIRKLSALIHRRHQEMPENSYTTRLFIKGVKKIAQKVGEEAVESAIEAVDHNRSRFIYEAADLMYHYLVLLEVMGCDLTDIEKELLLRHS